MRQSEVSSNNIQLIQTKIRRRVG